MAETLPPPETVPHHLAVVADVTPQGAKVVLNFTSEPHPDGWEWKLQAAYEHEWTGDNVVGARVTILR